MSETQNKELAKSYDPASIEAKWYPFWEKQGYFKAGLAEGKPSFSIQLPPPNITGILHMGHAFNHSVMDSLTRFYRMNGYNTMWLPGTDHAGIATQIVVERKLEAQGKNRRDMPRDEFVKEIWKWKDYSGGNILNQMRRLGDTLDWDRLYFTMNDDLAKVVVDCFVDLYEKGLIYRGRRLVNWDPKLQTSVSDLEVEPKEMDGHLWEIRYPAADGSEGVVVATTRPETMFGDQAVAVNPEDERYKGLVGKKLKLPLTDREIPVIADDYVDKEFGSGCVKITPAHDFNDFEVGKRHNLPEINILNDDGTINENGGKFEGMDRYEARKAIVKELEEGGYLVRIENHEHNVGTHDRCHTTVEPMIKKQWFVKMNEMAKPAIEAVKNGDLRFVPGHFDRTYLHWLENIRDWCISRQLWWGHRIPAYYCDDCGEIVVAKETPSVCPKCGCTHFTQDEDTLDTWFSSALWPFSTLGWPDKTEDLDYFYPTNVLVTGYDIIFFWVIRMVFSGYEQTGKCPFSDVLIHGLVRDEQGRKMSKSLGNGIDPLEIIDQYGADALRLTLVTGNAPGNDMRYSEKKIIASRNFANKVWNASRFMLMNIEKADLSNVSLDDLTPADKWILSKANSLVKEVTDNMENYDFGVAVSKLNDFIWEEFCDWYIEMVKPRLYNEEDTTKAAALFTLKKVLTISLKLLHPYMPFITEEIFCSLQDEEESIMVSDWPVFEEAFDFKAEENEVEIIKNAVRNIRNLRADMNVPPSKKASVYVVSEKEEVRKVFEDSRVFFATLGYASEVHVQADKAGIADDAVSTVIPDAVIYMPFAELVDVEKEIARLEKEAKRLEGEIKRAKGMLSNEKFISKAPAAKVEAEKEKLEKYTSMAAQVAERLSQLKK